jgi:hypothetical protein
VCRETAKERGAGVMADPSGFGKQGGEKAKEMGAGVMVGPFLLPTPTMVLPRVSVTFRKMHTKVFAAVRHCYNLCLHQEL